MAMFAPMIQESQPAIVYEKKYDYAIEAELNKLKEKEKIEQLTEAEIKKKQEYETAISDNNKKVAFDVTVFHSLVSDIKDDDTIQLRIVQAANDQSILANQNGLLDFKPIDAWIPALEHFNCKVFLRDIDRKYWKSGTYYKIQARYQRIKNDGFIENSEWSTVQKIKIIGAPTLDNADTPNVETDANTWLSYKVHEPNPLFRFQYIPADEENPEIEEMYRVDLLRFDAKTVIETSDWQMHKPNAEYDTWRFKYALEQDETYVIRYQARTINAYDSEIYDYVEYVNNTVEDTEFEKLMFIISDEKAAITNLDGKLEGYSETLKAQATNAARFKRYTHEEGCISIDFCNMGYSDLTLFGNYVLSRRSANVNAWEDIKFFYYAEPLIVASGSTIMGATDYLFHDITVESGVPYIYGFQKINESGLRSNRIESAPAKIYLEFAYLVGDDGKQLKLKFNQTMNSFKHTMLESKQDTLGGKYPTIMRNGDAFYAEFPLNNMISLAEDDYHFFEYGRYMHDEPEYFDYKWKSFNQADMNPILEKAEHLHYSDYIGLLKPQDIYDERKFRENVEQFITNGKYKLYRSPTEGNIVVVLINTSLKPQETLGRALMELSSTAYEVADNSFDTMLEYGIVSKGKEREEKLNTNVHKSVGQIFGQFAGQDIIQAIINEEKSRSDDKYEVTVQSVDSISIKPFIDVDYESYIAKLYQEDATEEEILKYQSIKEYLDNNSPVVPIHLSNKSIVAEVPEGLIRGDVNRNGMLDMDDAERIENRYNLNNWDELKYPDRDADFSWIGDANQDRSINIGDSRAIEAALQDSSYKVIHIVRNGYNEELLNNWKIRQEFLDHPQGKYEWLYETIEPIYVFDEPITGIYTQDLTYQSGDDILTLSLVLKSSRYVYARTIRPNTEKINVAFYPLKDTIEVNPYLGYTIDKTPIDRERLPLWVIENVPIIIDYTVTTTTTPKTQTDEDSIKYTLTSNMWSQLNGIFTTQDNQLIKGKLITKTAEQEAASTNLYYWGNLSIAPNSTVIYDTMSVIDIIKEDMETKIIETFSDKLDAAELLEEKGNYSFINNTAKDNDFYITKDDQPFGRYLLQQLNSIDIEAQVGTRMRITYKNGKTFEMSMGPTERYILRGVQLDNVKDIEFIYHEKEQTSVYAIINYNAKARIDVFEQQKG